MKRRLLVPVIGLALVIASISYAEQTTALSKKASQLKIGMARTDVIRLLGKPTWAVIPADKGELALPDSRIRLELHWKNSGCVPVAVQFDNNLKVTGWDEGKFCMKGAEAFEPSSDYSCSKSDRSKFCK